MKFRNCYFSMLYNKNGRESREHSICSKTNKQTETLARADQIKKREKNATVLASYFVSHKTIYQNTKK